MSTHPWKYAALTISELEIQLGHHEYLRDSGDVLYDPDGHREAEAALREWLCSVNRAIIARLAVMPEPSAPPTPPEKVAGFISHSIHG